MITTSDIIVAPPQADERLDPLSWFSSPGPLEMEIGCGKAGFLLSRARAHPEIRFLGLEWKNEYFKYAADRMARWQLTNVRIMRVDAGPFLARNLPDDCLSVLHLYHPDPWPKKRHHKRRLVTPSFVEHAARVIKPGGHWLIQSDHLEYFTIMIEHVKAHVLWEQVAWEHRHAQAGPGFDGTNFEVKYVREGRTIYRAAFQRRASLHAPAAT